MDIEQRLTFKGLALLMNLLIREPDNMLTSRIERSGSMMTTVLRPTLHIPYSKTKVMHCRRDLTIISTAKNVCRLGKDYRETT